MGYWDSGSQPLIAGKTQCTICNERLNEWLGATGSQLDPMALGANPYLGWLMNFMAPIYGW